MSNIHPLIANILQSHGLAPRDRESMHYRAEPPDDYHDDIAEASAIEHESDECLEDPALIVDLCKWDTLPCSPELARACALIAGRKATDAEMAAIGREFYVCLAKLSWAAAEDLVSRKREDYDGPEAA